jgi:hypothetical protein
MKLKKNENFGIQVADYVEGDGREMPCKGTARGFGAVCRMYFENIKIER